MAISNGSLIYINIDGIKKQAQYVKQINEKTSEIFINNAKMIVETKDIAHIPVLSEEQFREMRAKNNPSKPSANMTPTEYNVNAVKTFDNPSISVKDDLEMNMLIQTMDTLINAYSSVELIQKSLSNCKKYIELFRKENIIQKENNDFYITIYKHSNIAIVKDKKTNEETKLPLELISSLVKE